MDEVVDGLRKDAEQTKADQVLKEGDSYEKKIHEADMLRDVLVDIDQTKKDLPPKMKITLKGKLLDVMRAIANDPNLDPNK